MDIETSPTPPRKPAAGFHGGRLMLGLVLGLLVGLGLASQLPPNELREQVAIMTILLGGMGLGGWGLRWSRFPWMRALTVALSIGLLVWWGYQLRPPSSRVEVAKVRGPASRIDAGKLSIGGLAPGITKDEVKKRRGEPSSSRVYIKEEFGFRQELEELVYPDATATLYAGEVTRVEGPVLALNGVELVKEGDSHSFALDRFGTPSRFESREGLDVYHLHKPVVAVAHSGGLVEQLMLTSRPP